MNNKLLFLSEFEPVHFGLEKALQENISKDIAEVLFCIDGAYRKTSDETPFTTHEREEMINIMMKKYNIRYNFLHLRDEDTEEGRKIALHTLLKPLSGVTVLSDNKETHKIISGLGFDTKEIDTRGYIPGILRNQIASGHIKALKHKIPQDILDYIGSINGFERSREMKINLFHGPAITVDIIARNKKGEIAIIDRAHEPFGKALIGGFIEWGDSGEDTGHKETKEESNLHGAIASLPHQEILEQKIGELLQGNAFIYPYEKQPFYVLTDPQRDTRGHIMTLAYVIDVENENEIEALDDAKNGIQFMAPEIAVNHPEIFANHKTIIAAYLAQL